MRLVGTFVLLLAAALIVLTFVDALATEHPNELGWDFRRAYLPAAEAVLHGSSPYPSDAQLDSDIRASYAYPPQLALALSPLTLLPSGIALAIAVLGSLAALMGALAVVGVRDIRCYAAVVVWGSTWNAVDLANVSALLALLLAIGWRFRATLWPLAIALGTAISVKLFLWPMFVWMVATRRIRAAEVAALLGLAMSVAAWAFVGFAGIGEYLDLLDRISRQSSYSLLGIARALGAAHTANLVSIAVGMPLAAACAVVGRRGEDERSFVYAIGASLALTPVIWLHYLVILIVPLGIYRPRFSGIWLVPIVLWLSARSATGFDARILVPALVVCLVIANLLRSRGNRLPVEDAVSNIGQPLLAALPGDQLASSRLRGSPPSSRTRRSRQ